MLADKHTKNSCLLCDHSHHTARDNPVQDTLVRTPSWLIMMKAFLRRNGLHNPKLAGRNSSGRHHPMVTSLLDQSAVIIWPMKDGNGKRTFELGMIVTTSCHPWDSNVKQPTPGLRGTQWSKDLFRGKQKTIPFLISSFDSSELTPSQHNEPPIPPLSQSSKSQVPSHEDALTHEPEPEVAPTQSIEEPFGNHTNDFSLPIEPNPQNHLQQETPVPCMPGKQTLQQPTIGTSGNQWSEELFHAHPTTPHSIIIINDMPVGSPPPPPSTPSTVPSPDIPTTSSPWCKHPLIPTMRLGRNLTTCD
ncbi:hypothetical protein O181_030067 [Austropuccinia psidii MF-1]|uniref:Uncharacterized protein n=1 Tax=Austropuccinia psidii MF-1 TaxID=1389203 RepID=A0A9Q3CXV2_9BASI|nr:hypothetical protein [Austropuccinia psidii MF-1]